MKIGQKGLDLIKRFEGFKANSYICPAGKATIGYGHVILKREKHLRNVEITEERAEEILRSDCSKAELAVNRYINYELNQNQFDALVSFVFNIGRHAFKNSTLVRRLNLGEVGAVSYELSRWNKVKGVVFKGLVNRRNSEAELFVE